MIENYIFKLPLSSVKGTSKPWVLRIANTTFPAFPKVKPELRNPVSVDMVNSLLAASKSPMKNMEFRIKSYFTFWCWMRKLTTLNMKDEPMNNHGQLKKTYVFDLNSRIRCYLRLKLQFHNTSLSTCLDDFLPHLVLVFNFLVFD